MHTFCKGTFLSRHTYIFFKYRHLNYYVSDRTIMTRARAKWPFLCCVFIIYAHIYLEIQPVRICKYTHIRTHTLTYIQFISQGSPSVAAYVCEHIHTNSKYSQIHTYIHNTQCKAAIQFKYVPVYMSVHLTHTYTYQKATLLWRTPLFWPFLKQGNEMAVVMEFVTIQHCSVYVYKYTYTNMYQNWNWYCDSACNN